MRLLEAILAANQRAAPDGPVELAPDAHADALPLAIRERISEAGRHGMVSCYPPRPANHWSFGVGCGRVGTH